jgi:hypothetical protein
MNTDRKHTANIIFYSVKHEASLLGKDIRQGFYSVIHEASLLIKDIRQG